VAPVLIKLMLHLFLDYLKQDLGFYSDFCFLILTPIFLGMIMIDYCFFSICSVFDNRFESYCNAAASWLTFHFFGMRGFCGLDWSKFQTKSPRSLVQPVKRQPGIIMDNPDITHIFHYNPIYMYIFYNISGDMPYLYIYNWGCNHVYIIHLQSAPSSGGFQAGAREGRGF
jgi:hypothetical protein